MFDSPQKMLFGGLAFGLIIVGLLALGIVTYGVRKGSDNGFVLWGAEVFNVPVASINGLNVGYADYTEDLRALRNYNTQQGEPVSAQDESDRALSRLLVNRLTGDLAKKEGIQLTQEDIDQAAQTLRDQFPDEAALEQEMMTNFGWDFATFIDRIIIPSLREQKLAEQFSEAVAEGDDPHALEEVKARHILFMVDDETKKETVKADAEAVLQRIKDGENFEELAAEFGSDGTKDKGGDLGWFGRGVMVPPFEEAVFALDAGTLGEELVETQFGFHIVRVDEKRKVRDFAAFMDNQLSEADIQIYGNIHNPFEDLVSQ